MITLENVRTFFIEAGEAIATNAVWLGHEISVGFNDHVVPAMKSAWESICWGAEKSVEFFRTGNGFGTLGVIASVGFALGAIFIEDKVDSPERPWLRAALIALSIISAAGAGFAFSLGNRVLV